MVKTKNKHPIEFTTFGEFKEIYYHPIKNKRECMRWAERLSETQLRIRREDDGGTVAHTLASGGIFPKKFFPSCGGDDLPEDSVLMLRDRYGTTVAHWLAGFRLLPERFMTKKMLLVANHSGRTIAHWMAYRGVLPEKFITDDILTAANDEGWTVAHELALYGYLPDRFILLPAEEGKERRVNRAWLMLAAKNGKTIAHALSRHNYLKVVDLPEDILFCADKYGTTVAMELAMRGSFPLKMLASLSLEEAEKLLLVSDKYGQSIAQGLAMKGQLPKKFMTQKVLAAAGDGRTIAGFLIDRVLRDDRWDLLIPDMLDIPYKTSWHHGTGSPQSSGSLILSMVKKRLAKMHPVKLEEVLSKIPAETKLHILSKSRKSSLTEAMGAHITKETEQEIFSDGEAFENDWSEHLYGAGQER